MTEGEINPDQSVIGDEVLQTGEDDIGLRQTQLIDTLRTVSDLHDIYLSDTYGDRVLLVPLDGRKIDIKWLLPDALMHIARTLYSELDILNANTVEIKELFDNVEGKYDFTPREGEQR